MHRDRAAGGASKLDVTPIDRKRINEALDKQLERSSPSTSRTVINGKDKPAAAAQSVLMGKPPSDQRDSRSASLSKTNCSEESETDSEESDVSGSDGDDTSWISWFCNLRGNEFFCEVDDDYIQDDFNLCGLSSQVPYYDYALDLILDVESSNGDMFTEEQNELIESAAEMLYGLIHARYILTSKGMAAMLDKYKNYDFGRCPRVYCCGQPCLPVGQSDIPRSSTVKIYCPRCEDIYYPRSKYQGNIDGAYFGTTFPHLFLMTYGHLKQETLISNGNGEFDDDTHVVIAGLTNTYSQYVATFEEYEQQRYEAASTLYGPHTLSAYIQEFKKLAKAIAKGENIAKPIVSPPDLSSVQLRLVLDPIGESPRNGINFGDIQQDIKLPETGWFKRGEKQKPTATFWSANPRFDLLTEGTYAVVERLEKERWTSVYDDDDFSLFFKWTLDNNTFINSLATIEWDIPIDANPGVYRLRHFGSSKTSTNSTNIYFTGASRAFAVS